MQQRFAARATLRPDLDRPLKGEAAGLLKEHRLANCVGVRCLFTQRAEYAASLGMLFKEEPAAMAVYNVRMAELCDALDAHVDQAAAGDAIQTFWITFLELVDGLEHYRNERALPWDADNVRCPLPAAIARRDRGCMGRELTA